MKTIVTLIAEIAVLDVKLAWNAVQIFWYS